MSFQIIELLLPFLLLLIAAQPQPALPLLQQGLIALRNGQLDQAQSNLEEASRIDPENAYVWSSLAETYLRLKAPDKSASAAERAESLSNGDPIVSHTLAIYYSGAGQFLRAAALEEKFAASPRADPAALERTATLYLNGGDAKASIPLAQQALASHPSPAAEDLLGRALSADNQPAEARQHLLSALQSAPTDPSIAFDYAQFLLQQKDFGTAADVVVKALQTHPDDAQLVLTLGVVRYTQRRVQEAMAAFLRVITIDPSVKQPYQFLAKMLDQAGPKLPEILKAEESWTLREPDHGEAWLALAKTRLTLDSKDATVEGLLRRSITLDAINWEAHYELGALLESQRSFAGAAEELKRAIALDAKQASPHYHLARVYDRLGDSANAQAEREIHQQLTTPK